MRDDGLRITRQSGCKKKYLKIQISWVPHTLREGSCHFETELKECWDKIKNKFTNQTEKLMKCEELRR